MKPEVKKLVKIICDPFKFFQNFLASHIREIRIFTNAALFLPHAAGIRVKGTGWRKIGFLNITAAIIRVAQQQP